MSTNWAGYIATTGYYTAVSGSWNVPAATNTTGNTADDAAWIGIGGVSSGDLIQVGTVDSVTSSGVESSSAFYELLPHSAHTITSLAITPGDTMTAGIMQTTTGQWTITLTDTTTGRSFSTSVSYASSYSSAEWIEEDPSTTGGQLIPFDTFEPVTFTQGSTTDNGNAVSIYGDNAQPVTMVTTNRQPIAVPSALSGDGKGFTVTRN